MGESNSGKKPRSLLGDNLDNNLTAFNTSGIEHDRKMTQMFELLEHTRIVTSLDLESLCQ